MSKLSKGIKEYLATFKKETPKLYYCLTCRHAWWSRSKLSKPTCPKCKSHTTKEVYKEVDT